MPVDGTLHSSASRGCPASSHASPGSSCEVRRRVHMCTESPDAVAWKINMLPFKDVKTASMSFACRDLLSGKCLGLGPGQGSAFCCLQAADAHQSIRHLPACSSLQCASVNHTILHQSGKN